MIEYFFAVEMGRLPRLMEKLMTFSKGMRLNKGNSSMILEHLLNSTFRLTSSHPESYSLVVRTEMLPTNGIWLSIHGICLIEIKIPSENKKEKLKIKKAENGYQVKSCS